MDTKEGEASYSGDARDGRAQRRRERTSATLVGFDGGGRREEEEEKGREREGARGRVASERSWAWRLGFSTTRALLLYYTHSKKSTVQIGAESYRTVRFC